MIVGVINYGISGNIHSIQKALEKAGAVVKIVNNQKELDGVSKVVIPGVGSFKDAMFELEKNGLLEALKKIEKPMLGICLGMQILSTLGYEYGKTTGLNLIDAEVKPILVNTKVPHVGFNTISVVNKNRLLDGLENEEFYFMHSYEVVNYTDILSLTNYERHQFVSAVHKDNIYGVQFHPEKSREAGIQLFKNFIAL